MYKFLTTTFASGILCLAACGGPASNTAPAPDTPATTDIAPVSEESAAEPSKSTANEGVPLSIPSDAKANYSVLAIERGSDGLLLIQTKRVGPSGTSFSERQVNCSANTFAYTREGDTLEDLLAEARKPDPMGQRLSGSISDVVSQYACDHPPAG